MNTNDLHPLAGVFPALGKGENGDSAKLNCLTFHQGIYKPLFGVGMVKDFPELTAAQ